MKNYFLLLLFFFVISSFADAKEPFIDPKTELLRKNWKYLSYDLKDIIETAEGAKLKKPQEFLSDKGKPDDKDLEYVFSLKKIVCRDIDIFSGGFPNFLWTKYFPNLENLDLSCIPIASLKGIAHSEKIKSLGLGKLKHPEELLLLKKCKNLKSLRIILDNNSIKYLKELTSLEALTIVYSLNLTTIKPILNLNLKHLYLGDNKVSDKEIILFKKLHKKCFVEY
ncbi:MAG: hypothetical protein AABZ74_14205 [Cyanobacteriota bacterium]